MLAWPSDSPSAGYRPSGLLSAEADFTHRPHEAINRTTSAERAAVIFYGFVLLAISVVIGTLWRYVAGHRDLLEPEVTDEEIRAMTLLTTPSIGLYVVVVALALLAPKVAAFGYLLIAVGAVFRQRGDPTAAPPRA